ncbi:MAG: ParB/RepB/Spo0J family partition protein [Clostridia bacterium]
MSKGLGRGLGAFFDENVETVKEITNNTRAKEVKTEKVDYIDKVIELNIMDVEPMLNQPRKSFDKEKLEELSESIKIHGVIQPILVVKMDSSYTIVAGERRWRAAKLAGLKTIPAILKDYTDTKKKQVALIENIQREDLNAIEVAKAIKDLMDIDGYNMQEVANITGKNMSTVSNTLRLLRLPEEVMDKLVEGKLVEAQARALLALPEPSAQIALAEKIIAEKLTVREVEKLVYSKKDKPVKKETKKSVAIQRVEDELNRYFATKVKIDAQRNKGKIVIQYFNNDELTRIIDKLDINID